MGSEFNCSAFIRGGQDRLRVAHFCMATTMICPLNIGFVGWVVRVMNGRTSLSWRRLSTDWAGPARVPAEPVWVLWKFGCAEVLSFDLLDCLDG